MKNLIIGIDAADLETFQKLDLPNLNKILKEGINLNLELDLFSRGWAEILYGTHGRNLKALYKYPILDGSHNTTGIFRTPNGEDLSSSNALWKDDSGKEISIGLLNVPGSFPSPKIKKGFIVSGAGAGSPNDGKALVSEEMCSSEKVFEFINKSGYLGDVRFSKRKFVSHEEFFLSLIEHDKAISSTFLKLVEEFKPQVGFVVFTAFCRLSGIYRWHLENPNQNKNIDELIRNYILSFDNTISDLLDRLNPDSFIFTSDHGHTSRLYDLNINKLLEVNNFQLVNKKKSKLINNIKLSSVNSFKKILGKNLINKFSSKLPKKYIGNLKDAKKNLNINWSKSKAFGFRYIPGIYINDERFDGLVKNKEKEILVEKIIKKFNQISLLKKYNISFETYRSRFNDQKFSNFLPDIWINLPKGFFPVEDGDEVISQNKNYGPIDNIEFITEDLYAATKSKIPLACLSSSFNSELNKLNSYNDLTVINFLIRGL